MIGLLHYALLKSLRDRSLAAFLGAPALVVTASLLGGSLLRGQLRYPLTMSADLRPAQNTDLMAMIVTLIAISFTGMSAFWTFRNEVATKTIGSFMMARRPLSVALALVVFAAATGIAGWVAGMAAAGALTLALPANLASFALAFAIASLAAASLGALLVTISAQPATMAWAFLGSVPMLPGLLNASIRPQLLVIAPLVAMVCTGACAFLLERRCAA